MTVLRDDLAAEAVIDAATGTRSDAGGRRDLEHPAIDPEPLQRAEPGVPNRPTPIDYDKVVAGLLGNCVFVPCDQAAQVLLDHAVELMALGCDEEAITAYDEMIARLCLSERHQAALAPKVDYVLPADLGEHAGVLGWPGMQVIAGRPPSEERTGSQHRAVLWPRAIPSGRDREDRLGI